MFNDDLPECTSNNKKHTWVNIQKPDGCRSGYHVDICEICGLKYSYDTSD